MKAIINILSERLDRKPEQIENLLNSLSTVIADKVKDGDTVAIPGFGMFEPKMKAERLASHPATGRKILVPPKQTLVFKPSPLLKQKVKEL